MEELPLTDLGPYRLEKLLGRGGMGAVYQARDERLGRPVAVKHLPLAASCSELRRQRFRREALTLARLSHPAIVQIFDVVDTPEGDWIVMELVRGPTVGSLVENGPLPLPQLLRIGLQVTEGLAEAHTQGILHRDLKADNVMLHHTGHAKILDFGLAKVLGDEPGDTTSKTGQILGTVYAMSPEQARGLPLTPRSDLFSLGVLVYKMAAGEPPFRAPSNLEIVRRIVESPHVPLTSRRSDAPERLSSLVDRLLEKSPEHRPAGARAVADELSEIVADSRDGPSVATRVPSVSLPRDLETEVLEPGTQESGDPSFELPGPGSSRSWSVPAILLLLLLLAGAAIWQTLRGAGDIQGPPASAGELATYELLQEGMRYLERPDRSGNADKAIAAFEAVLARDERSASAHAGLALVYWGQHLDHRDPVRLEQAEAIAERAVQLDGHLALARIALGTIYAEAGMYADAQRELGTALQLSPGNAGAYRGLGIAHRHRGEHDLAREAFERAVAGRPADPYLRDELGGQYFRVGRYEEAAEQFSKSIELAPDGIYGYRNLSAAYYMQGRLPEAAEVLQKALLIKPEHSLYSNLGTLLFTQGLYLPAARAFRKALDHGGANFYLYWGNLGDAYRQAKGHDQAARDAFKQAIRLLREQPGHDGVASRLALYLAKAGRCDRGRTTLREVAFDTMKPVDAYRVAVTSEICGDREKALAALEAALTAGFSATEVARDPELFELRSDPRYHRMVAGLEAGGADPSPQTEPPVPPAPTTISGSTS